MTPLNVTYDEHVTEVHAFSIVVDRAYRPGGGHRWRRDYLGLRRGEKRAQVGTT